MQLVEGIRVKILEAYGDSKLNVNQVRELYEVLYEDLIPYHNVTIDVVEKFKIFNIDHILCQQNEHPDGLESLAASLALPVGATERVLLYSRDLYFCKFAFEYSTTLRGDHHLQIKEVLETSTSLEPRDWRFPYIDFILYGVLPDDPKEVAAIRGKVP